MPDIAAGRLGGCSRRPAGRRSRSSTAAAARAVRARGRRRAAAPDRRDAKRGVPAAAALHAGRAARAAARHGGSARLGRLIAELDDEELAAAIRDLGGHDLRSAGRAFRGIGHDRPSVIFAYTIKAWRLATQGHPATTRRCCPSSSAALADAAGRRPRDPWARFEDGTPRGRAVRARPRRLRRDAGAAGTPRPSLPGARPRPAPRTGLHPAGVRPASRRPRPRRARGGRARRHRQPRRRLLDQPRRLDQPGRGLVSSASGSTGSPTTPTRSCAGARSADGQHIELGIAEGNLVGLLGELGATWSRDGQPLLPIGTLYDPFVNRALEPWSFGIYAGGQSILVGTPSGVTLAPEGGAHQSIITPSVGLEQPRCVAWEPAFARTSSGRCCSLARLGRPDGTSAYFRLTTRPLSSRWPACPKIPRRGTAPPPGAGGRLSAAPRRRRAAGDPRGHGRGDAGGARCRGAAAELGAPADVVWSPARTWCSGRCRPGRGSSPAGIPGSSTSCSPRPAPRRS